MKIVTARMYIEPELAQFLKDTFRYDGEEGKVYRKQQPARGKRQEGAVGVFTGRTFMLNVSFQGTLRQLNMVVVVPILHIGKQYEGLCFEDGDVTNYKWSNLRMIGNERNDADYTEHNKARLEKLKITVMERKQQEQLVIIEQKKVEMRENERRLAAPPVEPVVDYAANWRAICEDDDKRLALIAREEQAWEEVLRSNECLLKIHRAREDAWDSSADHVMHLGVSSQWNTSDVRKFVEVACERIQTSQAAWKSKEWKLEVNSPDYYHDLDWAFLWLDRIERGLLNEVMFLNVIKKYVPRSGQKDHGGFDVMHPTWLSWLEARIHEIEKRYGTTEQEELEWLVYCFKHNLV